MERAEVMTPWTVVVDGSGESFNTPLLGQEHTLQDWSDTTGQGVANLLPDPNLYIIWVVATTASMDAIAADNTYYITWRQDV